MSTKKNIGVRNHNPNVAPAGVGSEVTVNPSAVIPAIATPPAAGTSPAVGTSPAAGAVLGLSAVQLNAVVAAAKSYREGFSSLTTAFRTALELFPSPDLARKVAITAQRKQVAALYAGLLREEPTITASVDPDVIDAGLAVDAALAMVKRDLQQVIPMVTYCGIQSAAQSWSDASVVRTAAKAESHKDKFLVPKIAVIEGLLRRGKRVSTAGDSAAKAQAKALKTQQRAAAEVTKAQAKAARAERSATRAAQAHADNHPTTPDVVIIPAGSTTPVTPTPTNPAGTPPKG